MRCWRAGRGGRCRSASRAAAAAATTAPRRRSATLGFHDDGFARAEDRAVLASLLRPLSARQRVVLHLRFEHGMTQTQIANVVGLSQMHVSRIIRDAVVRMNSSAETSSRRVSAG